MLPILELPHKSVACKFFLCYSPDIITKYGANVGESCTSNNFCKRLFKTQLLLQPRIFCLCIDFYYLLTWITNLVYVSKVFEIILLVQCFPVFLFLFSWNLFNLLSQYRSLASENNLKRYLKKPTPTKSFSS